MKQQIIEIVPISVVYIPCGYSKLCNRYYDCDNFIVTCYIKYWNELYFDEYYETKRVCLKDCKKSFMNIVKNDKISDFEGYSINPNDIKIDFVLRGDDIYDIIIDKDKQEEHLIKRMMGE